MTEFPIYREVSRGERGSVEIAVLTVRTVGGQAVMRSVNRHVYYQEGGRWIGRHPDYYDGVDFKNARAEKMFAKLENDLEKLTQKLELLDEKIGQWVEESKFNELALDTANECAESDFKLDPSSVLSLIERIQPLAVEKLKKARASVRAEAINARVKAEHAKNYLADVQRDFPRLVAYVRQK